MIATDVTPPRDSPARTGVWVGIGAIAMSFAAYTSAMVVRGGSAPDWQHFPLPRILYLNTIVLVASSLTVEAARRRVRAAAAPAARTAAARRELIVSGLSWLYLTLALGLMFLVGQVLAWRTLVAQGLYLSTNPSSSFFYLFTAAHGLHLLGGLAGLTYAAHRASATIGRPAVGALGAAALYWHFMGVLWLYLLLILALWV
jgi:cytochrome c oxidase subunit III